MFDQNGYNRNYSEAERGYGIVTSGSTLAVLSIDKTCFVIVKAQQMTKMRFA